MTARRPRLFRALAGATFLALFQLCFAPQALAISEDDAFFLLMRTGFHPTQARVKALAASPSRAAAISVLVNGVTPALAVAPPAWTSQPITPPPPYCGKLTDPAAIAACVAADSAYWSLISNQKGDLRAWYVAQMMASPSPLTERLTLFWHNHFTTQLSKSGEQPWLVFNQHRIIRRNAAGSFSTMLAQIMTDPAMLIFLDQQLSTAKAPTANFARELMELFTLGQSNAQGVPNYTETTVTEVARALTGLNVDSATGLFLYKAADHDTGVKTILGQTGNFDYTDVARILLANPNCPILIVSELWKEFVSPTPDMAQVATIASSFGANYQIAPVLTALFNSDAFWSPANRGTLVKSPSEFIVGAARALSLPNSEASGLASMISYAGTPLFDPPNVRGFLTGVDSMSTYTLAARQLNGSHLANLWVTEVLPAGDDKANISPSEFAAIAAPNLLAPAMLLQPTANITPRTAAARVLADPAYSLK